MYGTDSLYLNMIVKETILCPYCGTMVNNSWSTTGLFEREDDEDDLENDEYIGKQIWYTDCVNCYKLVIRIIHGEFYFKGSGYFTKTKIKSDWMVYPSIKSEASTEFIPNELANDYNEAVKVLPISPKSSAALTRRILQTIFRDYYSIKERTLDSEINKFISLPDIPSHLSDAVDAVRTIGNIAAHPSKDKNTGLIVDVEPGEAEWLIEVIETLFDFTFIQPRKLEERRNDLNKKLESLGKPKLKSGK